MTNIDYTSLNDAQLLALKETEGAVLVTAGAGSGKTKLLTHRIAYLIEEKGVRPYNILAITFTNKAAGEMSSRLENMLGYETTKNVWISTFHSMCVKILRQNISNLEGYTSSFSIYSDSDQSRVFKTVYQSLNIKDDNLKKEIEFHISNIKNHNVSIMDYEKENFYLKNIKEIVQSYIKYQQILRENNALDFDDLLIKTYELFCTCPEVLEKYAEKFRYISVDEFQDTNAIQYALVKLLASKHGNIFVVGDEDQCIYSWRGANFRNIFKFLEDFAPAKRFKLEQNYRSTKTILSLANKIIKNNRSRLDKELWTQNAEGYKIEYHSYSDEMGEAESVAQTIRALAENKGYKNSDFAVLVRLNALTMPFEERFLAYNIPHAVFGGFKFFERAEIKNLIAYLRLIENPKDNASFLRVVNFPKRGLGDGAIAKLQEYADENALSLCESTEKLGTMSAFTNSVLAKFAPFGVGILATKEFASTNKSLSELIGFVTKRFQVKSAYASGSEQDEDKKLNIDAFIMNAEEFEKKNPQATLCDYLESISLISDIDNMEDGDNTVKIATIHAVKGLEFKVVFVVGLEEGIFPIKRAFGNEDELEEERRLAYVALTRAKERLFLSRSKSRFMYGKREYMMASRFTKEMGFEDKEQTASEGSSQSTYSSMAVKTKFTPTKVGEISLSSLPKPNANTQITTSQKDISLFKVGQNVSHTRFNDGVIISIDYDGRCADIEFEGFGVKTLLLDIAPLTIVED